MISTINNNICEIMVANSTIYWNSGRLNNNEYEFEPNLVGSHILFSIHTI